MLKKVEKCSCIHIQNQINTEIQSLLWCHTLLMLMKFGRHTSTSLWVINVHWQTDYTHRHMVTTIPAPTDVRAHISQSKLTFHLHTQIHSLHWQTDYTHRHTVTTIPAPPDVHTSLNPNLPFTYTHDYTHRHTVTTIPAPPDVRAHISQSKLTFHLHTQIHNLDKHWAAHQLHQTDKCCIIQHHNNILITKWKCKCLAMTHLVLFAFSLMTITT